MKACSFLIRMEPMILLTRISHHKRGADENTLVRQAVRDVGFTFPSIVGPKRERYPECDHPARRRGVLGGV